MHTAHPPPAPTGQSHAASQALQLRADLAFDRNWLIGSEKTLKELSTVYYYMQYYNL